LGTKGGISDGASPLSGPAAGGKMPPQFLQFASV